MKFPSDIPTAVTNREAAKLADLASGGVILELGAQFGFSTIVMSETAKRVHSVDTHQGDTDAGYLNSLPAYVQNLLFYGARNVVTHVGSFDEVLPLFKAESFDGCFLDGSHDLDSVLRDTFYAMQLVKHGGWLAWHDYGRYDVEEAVNSLADLKLNVVDFLAWARI